LRKIVRFFLAGVLLAAIAGAVIAAVHSTMPGWYARWWYPLEHAELIAAYSRSNGLDPALVAAVIYTESSFDNDTTSRAGAAGLMQVLPSTAYWIAGKRGENITAGDLRDPERNIDFGCWYLRYLIDRYQDQRLALAAYNGGAENVDQWLATARSTGRDFDYVLDIPYRETRDYITGVEQVAEIYRRAYPEELGIN